jgi:MoaA/NifB/PqqE/SkfB family radical SAM enzyme
VYGLDPNVVLRFEPQFYSTYAAFHCRRVETCFYPRWQFEVLDDLARQPSNVEETPLARNIDKDKLRGFLDSQLQSGFVVVGNQENPSPVHVPARVSPDAFDGFPSPFLSAPSTVDVFLTRACNLKCSHCFSQGGRPLKNELSLEEWVSVFNQLDEMGTLQVRLNGGEPLMHPRIYDILAHLNHVRFRKVILTNGTMLNEKVIDALINADITPTVSLDGPTARIHDDFRGVPGAFDRTLRALGLLREKRMTYGINTCVHSGNIWEIEDMVQLAIKFGAARIGLLGLIESGRLATTKKNIVSEPEYVLLNLGLLRVVRKYGAKIQISETIVSHGVPIENVGVFACSIDSDGGVYPANRVLGDAKFRIGSLRESTLREIWFSHGWIPFRRGLKKSRALGLEVLQEL